MHRTARCVVRGLTTALLLTVGLAGAGTAANAQSATAPAAKPNTAGALKVVSIATGKCVDVPRGDHLNGRRLQEFRCTGNVNQQWVPLDLGNGFFLLQSVNTPGLCMNARTNDVVEQATCSVTSQFDQWQVFSFNNFGDTGFRSALPGNKCLALSPNTEADGTSLVIQPCDGFNSAQFWRFG